MSGWAEIPCGFRPTFGWGGWRRLSQHNRWGILGSPPLPDAKSPQGTIESRQWLGGLLKHCYRAA